MKFQVTMKDPDTLHEAVYDAVKDDIKKLNLPDDEAEQLVDIRMEKVNVVTSKWFKYGEYLTVEIDTEAETATVLRN